MLGIILLQGRQLFLGAITLSTLLMAQLSVADVIAIEEVRKQNLNFRGQGGSGLCYAFAEEQIIKDLICSGDCSTNADEWKLSIFDIAKVHQEKAIQYNPDMIIGDKMVDLTANGSSHFFPYLEMGTPSVRASNCTLEKELFYLNRSKLTNPDRLPFHEFVMDIYDRYSANNLSVSDIEPLISSAAVTLKELATSSSDRLDFLTKTIEYSSCEDRVQIPEVELKREDHSEESKIKDVIMPLLKEGRSLYVGVCAEVIKSENNNDAPCSRHAVVLKGFSDPTCKGDQCQLGVIDSAFFSLRPMNDDGSAWVPLKVVAQAISKSSLDFQRIIAEAKASNRHVIDSFDEVAKIAAREFIQTMKDSLRTIPGNKLKESLIEQIKKMGSEVREEPSDANKAFIAKLIQEVEKLSLKNLSELDLLEAPAVKVYLAFFQDSFAERLSKMDSIQSNGIVWVERK